MLHNAGEYQERQYLKVVQSKSWRETRRGVVGIRSNGKVEVVSIYRDIRRFIYRFDGIFFFALPPRALKEKQFDLPFTVHFNRNGGGQFHDFFAFSLLALYNCKQNVNLPKRNFMYELI